MTKLPLHPALLKQLPPWLPLNGDINLIHSFHSIQESQTLNVFRIWDFSDLFLPSNLIHLLSVVGFPANTA